MEQVKRATIYLNGDLHRALRLRAAATDRTISEMVNEAVKLALAEDAEDLSDIAARKAERGVSFERFVQGLRRRGRL